MDLGYKLIYLGYNLIGVPNLQKIENYLQNLQKIENYLQNLQKIENYLQNLQKIENYFIENYSTVTKGQLNFSNYYIYLQIPFLIIF